MQGRHVKVVGRARSALLSNHIVIEGFLRDISHAVGSKPAALPLVQIYVDGASGSVISATAHVVIHTWFVDRRLMLDLFSMSTFHDLTVIAAISRHFGISRYHLFDFTSTLSVTP